jgi:3,4-dihydroxy 2-butanone 4-phosphate synthase/GTP cyclohydrolase II
MAGLNPSAVICEIMNDDGTMARMPDLVAFAQKHNLKIGTIEDLIAFRLQNDRIVTRVTERKVHSDFGGDFDLHVYATTVDGVEHLALVKGDLSAPGPVPVRVHAVNVLGDLLGIGGMSAGSVATAMRYIEREGRGVIVLIRDLRSRSVSESFQRRAEGQVRKIQGHERRNVEIGIGSQILSDLGVSEMVLLSNSTQSTYVGLDGFGLKIVRTEPLTDPDTQGA